ncbi:protein DROOPING LEAF-like [Dendrobium catenatum]|uniref:Protein DROOPING LEAF n=1 Tax=Dendrobium catenatum TaxID=906689 RepID=A0A2I0W8W6_9ASPA|nr:protein DROOPING LEAF-like [Dendrobium catenatum]PKU72090.1 Protein DROOPING LEAF [Dendrobium catenatum]
MDLSSSSEKLCYVHCSHCNIVLAVEVPCSRMMETVTVKCGHCNNISYISPEPKPNSQYFDYQMDFTMGQQSDASSSTSIEQKPEAPPVAKPPKKKQKQPTAYNVFVRQEIQRIKAEMPEITHTEAFSMASKNWARYGGPLNYGLNPLNTISDDNESVESVSIKHESGNGSAEESYGGFRQMKRHD